MLPTDPPRNPFRRLLIYFGLAEGPSGPAPEPNRAKPARASSGGQVRSTLQYFGLVEGPSDSRYGAMVKPELDEDVDALRARVAELEARLAALEDAR